MYKILSFLGKMVNLIWENVDAILKQLFDAKILIERLLSLIVPKNYGSPTWVTR